MQPNDTMIVSAGSVRGVIIVSPGGLHGRGGMGSVTREMARWFAKASPQTKVAVVDPRGSGPALLWPLRLTLAVVQIVFIALLHRPQVMHLQVSRRSSFIRKGVLLGLGKALGMRVVLHHHGSEFASFFAEASPRMKAWVRWVIFGAHANIVLGEKARAYLVEVVGVGDRQVLVRANAIADVLDKAGTTRAADPWNLVFIANLLPRKGIETLLQAISQLVAQGEPVRLTLVGDGDIDRYRQMARALKIEDRCRFTGWVDGKSVQAHLATHGVLVLPSLHEGMPMAILEALAAGLPIVTTPVGAIPELLVHQHTCLFVNPEDVNELSKALTRLCRDTDLRARLGANGRRLYEDRLEIGAYMAEMVLLYNALLESTHQRRPGFNWSRRPNAE